MANVVPVLIADAADPVVDAYKRDVDRTLIRENLRKSYEERLITLQEMIEVVHEAQRAGRVMRGEQV
jgi:hypothetical protein